MTSVNSYGGATSAGNYTLVFSGTFLGDWIDSYRSNARKPTPPAERQNFWSTQVLVDPSYPAFAFDHEFVLYTESGSFGGFLKRFHGLTSAMNLTRPYPLQMWSGTTTPVVIDYGLCTMTGFEMDKPQDLLLYRAGMITVSFLGTSVPSVAF